MHEVPEGRQSLNRARFSGPARLVALLLTLPCLFLLDRPLDFGVAFLLTLACWLAVSPVSNPLPALAGFVWLGPGIVLVNALAGPQPRHWGFFSTAGARLGFVLALRLLWAAALAHVLVRSCPRDELFAALRALLRFLRVPERHALTLFLTLELLPVFSTIRAGELRQLPQAIADRIAVGGDIAAGIPESLPPACSRLRPADALLVATAAGLTVFAVLV